MEKIKQAIKSPKAILLYKHFGMGFLILLIVSIMQVVTRSNFWLLFGGVFLGRQYEIFLRNWEALGKKEGE